MSIPLILGCVWVIAAAVVAMLPMPRQMLPGTVLLIAAPVLLGWIGWVLLSMFRRPLLYFGRRAVGLPAEVPPELRK
jgi:Protein of unknown function (DUF2484)